MNCQRCKFKVTYINQVPDGCKRVMSSKKHSRIAQFLTFRIFILKYLEWFDKLYQVIFEFLIFRIEIFLLRFLNLLILLKYNSQHRYVDTILKESSESGNFQGSSSEFDQCAPLHRYQFEKPSKQGEILYFFELVINQWI